MLSILIQIVLAYIVIDAITGIYHIITDKGWNPIKSQNELFQRHHKENSMDYFDFRPSLAALPMLALSWWIASPFLIALSIFGIFSQLPHYWAHQNSNNIAVVWLQELRLIISRDSHQQHHSGDFNRNFCIINGWNNWWLNWIAKKLF